MKLKVVEVSGEGGVFCLPVSDRLCKALGWKEGDELEVDKPDFRFGKCDYLIVTKKGS